MSENGCGITALSIILSGYDQKYSPEDLREKYYPVLKYDSLSKELSDTFKIKNTDFYYDSKYFFPIFTSLTYSNAYSRFHL